MKKTKPPANHPLKFTIILHLACPGFVLVDLVPGTLNEFEWKLLSLFATMPGRLVTRAAIYDCIWENRVVEPQQIDTQISNLRKALDRISSGRGHLIVTIRKQGYMLDLTRADCLVAPCVSAIGEN